MAVLVGPPNSGKSTTTWMLMKDNSRAEYFGDDLLICRKDGLIRPFPVASRIHSGFLKSVGKNPSQFYVATDLLSGMPNDFRLASAVRSLPLYPWARMLAEAYGPWHYENVVKIDQAQVMSMSGMPSALFFIEAKTESGSRISREEAIGRLRVLQQLEFGVESDPLLNLSAMVSRFPDMKQLHDTQESCISSIAEKSEIFVVNGASQAKEFIDLL